MAKRFALYIRSCAGCSVRPTESQPQAWDVRVQEVVDIPTAATLQPPVVDPDVTVVSAGDDLDGRIAQIKTALISVGVRPDWAAGRAADLACEEWHVIQLRARIDQLAAVNAAEGIEPQRAQAMAETAAIEEWRREVNQADFPSR